MFKEARFFHNNLNHERSLYDPGGDGNVVPGTERRPDPGIEEPEVIVDPGDRPDR